MVTPSSNAGCRGYAPCAAENIREFKGTDCDDDMVTPSSKADENGESGLLEVIESGRKLYFFLRVWFCLFLFTAGYASS